MSKLLPLLDLFLDLFPLAGFLFGVVIRLFIAEDL